MNIIKDRNDSKEIKKNKIWIKILNISKWIRYKKINYIKIIKIEISKNSIIKNKFSNIKIFIVYYKGNIFYINKNIFLVINIFIIVGFTP